MRSAPAENGPRGLEILRQNGNEEETRPKGRERREGFLKNQITRWRERKGKENVDEVLKTPFNGIAQGDDTEGRITRE